MQEYVGWHTDSSSFVSSRSMWFWRMSTLNEINKLHYNTALYYYSLLFSLPTELLVLLLNIQQLIVLLFTSINSCVIRLSCHANLSKQRQLWKSNDTFQKQYNTEQDCFLSRRTWFFPNSLIKPPKLFTNKTTKGPKLCCRTRTFTWNKFS